MANTAMESIGKSENGFLTLSDIELPTSSICSSFSLNW